MRTTLDIDDDVMATVRSLAQQRKEPMGRILSLLARRALQPQEPAKVRNGVPLFPANLSEELAELELVNSIRDE